MKKDLGILDDVDPNAINDLIAENVRLREELDNGGDVEILAQDIDFVDGEERNRTYPDTFKIPSQIERYGVQPGNFVKVILESERFWIEVVNVQKVDGEKIFIGFVAEPIMNDKINYQSLVIVRPKHIIYIG